MNKYQLTLTDFGQVFRRAIDHTRAEHERLKRMNVSVFIGEFEGSAIENCADEIIDTLEFLASVYPDVPADQMVAELEFMVMKKLLIREGKMANPKKMDLDL